MKVISFISLLLAQSLVLGLDANFAFEQYSQRFSSDVMDQRLCLSVQTGFKFVASNLDTIVRKYVEMYNEPEKFELQMNQTSSRYKWKV
jgi:hypothetical protein